jgi:hypothetical protein
MKTIHLRFAIPVVLAAAMVLGAAPTFAKTALVSRQAQSTSQAAGASSHSQSKTRAYAGNVVVQPNGTVALQAGGHNYKLSNQSKAAKFANKKVIVTGTYNPQSGTIQVKQIKPAQTVKH